MPGKRGSPLSISRTSLPSTHQSHPQCFHWIHPLRDPKHSCSSIVSGTVFVPLVQARRIPLESAEPSRRTLPKYPRLVSLQVETLVLWDLKCGGREAVPCGSLRDIRNFKIRVYKAMIPVRPHQVQFYVRSEIEFSSDDDDDDDVWLNVFESLLESLLMRERTLRTWKSATGA